MVLRGQRRRGEEGVVGEEGEEEEEREEEEEEENEKVEEEGRFSNQNDKFLAAHPTLGLSPLNLLSN